MESPSQRYEARIEEGKLYYDKRWWVGPRARWRSPLGGSVALRSLPRRRRPTLFIPANGGTRSVAHFLKSSESILQVEPAEGRYEGESQSLAPEDRRRHIGGSHSQIPFFLLL